MKKISPTTVRDIFEIILGLKSVFLFNSFKNNLFSYLAHKGSGFCIDTAVAYRVGKAGLVYKQVVDARLHICSHTALVTVVGV